MVLILVWHFAGATRASPALPPPLGVLGTTWELLNKGVYTDHITASLEIILLGIAIAVLFGFVLGLLMFMWEGFRLAILPLIESVRGVAALTLFPLLIVLFGIGTFSRVFVIFWTAWPAVVLSTMSSLKVDEHTVSGAYALGAGEWRVLLSLRIRMALPGVLTGVRIGVSGGWIGLVAAEMLGATRGLGFFLLWSAQSFQFERVYATIIIIATIGGLMNFGMMLLQRKLSKLFGGKKMKNKIMLIIAVSILAIILAGCGRQTNENGTIRYIGFRVYDPVYVAYELGLFEKHGVNVEIIDLMTAGPTALQAISGGNAEAGLSFIGSIVNARAQGMPVIGVSDIQSSFAHAPLAEFFVRADSGIYSVEDIRGRTVAINLVHASFHHKWLMAIEAVGIEESEVHWTVLPFEQQALALANGHVDAIGVLQPHTVIARENENFRRLFTAYDVFGERQFTTHVFNSIWAENNPKAVTAFVAAITEATAWIADNQEAAAFMVSQHTGVNMAYIEDYFFQPNARVDMEDAQFWLDYMRRIGLITADWLTVEDFATNRFNPFEMEDQ